MRILVCLRELVDILTLSLHATERKLLMQLGKPRHLLPFCNRDFKPNLKNMRLIESDEPRAATKLLSMLAYCDRDPKALILLCDVENHDALWHIDVHLNAIATEKRTQRKTQPTHIKLESAYQELQIVCKYYVSVP